MTNREDPRPEQDDGRRAQSNEATPRSQPEDRGATRPGYDGRPREYVIVLWASEQLRDQMQRNGRSLYHALQAGRQQAQPAEAPEPGDQQRDGREPEDRAADREAEL